MQSAGCAEVTCRAQEIVALKPSFLNHGDRGGSFFVGVIVWNGNIKTGYEGLFDLGEVQPNASQSKCHKSLACSSYVTAC